MSGASERTGNRQSHLNAANDSGRMTDKPEVGCPQIASVNRPTRTLSEPDGICSSGLCQHPATALAPPLGRKTPIPDFWRNRTCTSKRPLRRSFSFCYSAPRFQSRSRLLTPDDRLCLVARCESLSRDIQELVCV